MAIPILATKLYSPAIRSKIVLRPRLIAQLTEGFPQRKLTLISAPAGFGKTTLASEWVRNSGHAVAWLSLDAADNDTNRLLAYLIAALQTAVPELGSGLAQILHSAQRPPIQTLLTTLLNEIAVLPAPLILVLDDFHLLDSPAASDMIAFLLEHQPPHFHLVLTTREDPTLPLPRLRVRNQLTELRAADLRFTPEETADFLNQVMGLQLSAAEIAALDKRTEGWIAGLQMAALSMQGRADTTRFIDAFTGSHRFVVDYLIEEIFQTQPAPIRQFLQQTAVLDRLNAPLCDAVTGQENGREMLETLERNNLFVMPLDDSRQWYRYHHLFADVLQARLLQEQPTRLPSLHKRASDWYEQNGFPAAAIHHALAADDYEHAAALIELARPEMDVSFQMDLWRSWVEALPADMIPMRPILSVDYAWALQNGGELERSEARLQDAERWLAIVASGEESPERMVVVDQARFPSLPSSIASARAYRALAVGNVTDTVRHAEAVLARKLEGDEGLRVAATSLLGLAQFFNGNLVTADRALTDFMHSTHQMGDVSTAISIAFVLSDLKVVRGRLNEATQTYEQMIEVAKAHGLPVGTADLYRGLAELCIERGTMETAVSHLSTAQALGDQAALTDWPCRLFVAQARLKAAEGDVAGAIGLLNEAQAVHIRTPLPDVDPLTAQKVRLWLRQGNLAEANKWAQAMSLDENLAFLREYEHITWIRVQFARYRQTGTSSVLQEAADWLRRLLQAAEVGERNGRVIDMLILQARILQAQNKVAEAVAALQHALELAEPEGYLRIFVAEGDGIMTLLPQVAARDNQQKAYIRRLLAAAVPKKPAAPASAQPLLDPLSERELEVLNLIAEGLSNRQISERLFLALSTVKGHNRIIFSKLQVQRRTEAVARARELGLVSL